MGYPGVGLPALSRPVFLGLAGQSLYIGLAYIFPATPEGLYKGSARLRDTGSAPKRRKSDKSGVGRRHVHLRPALKSALKIALSLNFQFEQNRA